jgi:hypothetical protein
MIGIDLQKFPDFLSEPVLCCLNDSAKDVPD